MIDVLVAGAGPTGLLLAGDLAAQGVRVTLVERRAEESNLTRAFAVHARTMEQLDARGLADEVLAGGNSVDRLGVFGRATVDLRSLPTRFPFVLVTPQYAVERVLEDRAARLGATILRGVRVRDLAQDADGVTVDCEGLDGEASRLRASYLVGTDGHHSAVRDALGLDFPGASVVRSVILADVRMSDPPAGLLNFNANGEGFFFVVPFGDGWFRVITRDPDRELPDDAPVDLAEIRGLAERVVGTDFGMTDPRWMSRFHSDERQVPRYRVGRVLLAGDAAHVHSPAGGMGMNTGLQDAANLGWKLATVVAGRGGDRLLDSYHDERHPVGRMVLRTSGGLIRAALLRRGPARALRDAAATTALRLPPVTRRLGLRISGLGIAYDPPPGSHRPVGTRAPDVTGTDGLRLYEALRSGRHVLVAPKGFPAPTVDGRLQLLPLHAGTPRLVRPDGYVGWAGDGVDGLTAALEYWGVLGPGQPGA
ncbi:FAD-dependent monooxygenase [Nocardioides sp.]|uniref:FAD-dependent monooxygenase n=1 Tax=Nocardioides sp. TaxID=35761 RepID=UPI002D80D24B|nr:FAD-dependent monooxygenase [Nocardioides sp.]HET8961676.1 FAD-dependent monooxygenase [Nocardioides sp.]